MGITTALIFSGWCSLQIWTNSWLLLVLLPWLLPSQRLKLTQLSFMEPMDMQVWDTLAILDMLDILMLMDMLDILMLQLDMLPTAHLPVPALLVLPLLLSQL